VNAVILVMFVLQVAVSLMALYAFVHAALQRPDAYTATDKMTKPVWLTILGVATLLAVVVPGSSVIGLLVGACAAGVYLADVRPKLLEIQGKSR
jgi:4-amino-4-deoxy-L-arabinose transferase-like glycosyltransferase